MLQHKNRKLIYADVNEKIITLNNKRLVLTVIQDITEKKQLQHSTKMKEMMLLRSQRLASLGSLSSAIAHEIRQPLNLIKIISDTYIYAKKKKLDDEIKKVNHLRKMKQISEGVERINEIINGRRGITPSTALRLAKFFGVSPDFWMNLQLRWDLYFVQQYEEDDLKSIKPLVHL